MIQATTAVEDDLGDTLLDRTTTHDLADRLGGVDVAASLDAALDLILDGRGGREGHACHVVDDLGVDVCVAPRDPQTRTHGGPGDLAANPALTAGELERLCLQVVHFLSLIHISEPTRLGM